jgi:hypothetical protein
MIVTADQALMEKERAKSIQGTSSCMPHSPNKMSKRNSAASQESEKEVKVNRKPYAHSPTRAAGPDGYDDYLDSSDCKKKRPTFSPKLDVANEIAANS